MPSPPHLGRLLQPYPPFKAYLPTKASPNTPPVASPAPAGQALWSRCAYLVTHVLPHGSSGADVLLTLLSTCTTSFSSFTSMAHVDFKLLGTGHVTTPRISCSTKHNAHDMLCYAIITNWMNGILAPSWSPSPQMKNDSNLSFSIVQLRKSTGLYNGIWPHKNINHKRSSQTIRINVIQRRKCWGLFERTCTKLTSWSTTVGDPLEYCSNLKD